MQSARTRFQLCNFMDKEVLRGEGEKANQHEEANNSNFRKEQGNKLNMLHFHFALQSNGLGAD